MKRAITWIWVSVAALWITTIYNCACISQNYDDILKIANCVNRVILPIILYK
jgi:hypothetical protein